MAIFPSTGLGVVPGRQLALGFLGAIRFLGRCIMSNLAPLLSEEQIEAFFEIGFVIVPDVFTPTEIEEMRAGFDRLQKIAYALSESRDPHTALTLP